MRIYEPNQYGYFRSPYIGLRCMRGRFTVDDPAAVTGSRDEILAAFAVTFDQMAARVAALLALGDAPIADLMPQIRAIGELP